MLQTEYIYERLSAMPSMLALNHGPHDNGVSSPQYYSKPNTNMYFMYVSIFIYIYGVPIYSSFGVIKKVRTCLYGSSEDMLT